MTCAVAVDAAARGRCCRCRSAHVLEAPTDGWLRAASAIWPPTLSTSTMKTSTSDAAQAISHLVVERRLRRSCKISTASEAVGSIRLAAQPVVAEQRGEQQRRRLAGARAPRPACTPVRMPGRAVGSRTCSTTCVCVAPMPMAASRISARHHADRLLGRQHDGRQHQDRQGDAAGQRRERAGRQHHRARRRTRRPGSTAGRSAPWRRSAPPTAVRPSGPNSAR